MNYCLHGFAWGRNYYIDCALWLWAWAYSAGAQAPGEPPEFSPFQRKELYVPFALNMTTV